ncbi:MAG: hypothetical protein K2N65_06335, partial [Anaeroplasmataceae bacterium]|nr:hypothetical protein [Anaeroplasmataceae bacterium]
MLDFVYHTHLQVATIIILIIMTVNSLVCYPLQKKRNNYFSKFDSICGYIALIPFVSGLIVGITFMISYVLFYQALNHIIDKLCLLHLIYLGPLFFISLYLLIKSWVFKMKLEDGYLIIRNAFGITSK